MVNIGRSTFGSDPPHAIQARGVRSQPTVSADDARQGGESHLPGRDLREDALLSLTAEKSADRWCALLPPGSTLVTERCGIRASGVSGCKCADCNAEQPLNAWRFGPG